MNWSGLSEWWISEIAGDPAYDRKITPLLLEVLEPESGMRYLDVGCGEGRVMQTVQTKGASVVGLDLSYELIRRAGSGVVADLSAIPARDDSFDGAYSVLTLEHVEDHRTFFGEAARVTKRGGTLGIVINHPVWTAPDSTPISDAEGEVLWRPGRYFSDGSSEVPAGESTIIFHHRSMMDLLNGATNAGWSLERMIEQPHHEYEDQAGIPRLLACRWRLLP